MLFREQKNIHNSQWVNKGCICIYLVVAPLKLHKFPSFDRPVNSYADITDQLPAI